MKEQSSVGSMALYYRTQGFVLKKIDRGEADRVFIVYTRDFGKLEILAKAIRKMKSKLRKGVETLYLSEVEFIQGKTYKTLTDAVLIKNFQGIRRDLKKLALFFQISGILDDLIRKGEKDEKIWNLLSDILGQLNNHQSPVNNQQLLFYYFIWNFFSLLGYRPELHTCSLCQKKLIPQNLYFNFKEGGVICGSCFQRVKEGERISPETIKILRFILEKEWQVISRLEIEEKYFPFLRKTSDYWIHFLPKATSSHFGI